MDRFGKILVSSAIVPLVLIAVFVVGIYIDTNNKPKPITSGMFYIKHGSAMCGQHYITECGVHLKKCTDEKEYHCLHDVAMDLDKKE